MLLDNTSIIFILFPIAVFAGAIGSILGLGGGIILVPFMTMVFGVKIQTAIAISLISIIATSSGAAVAFLKDRLTNLRLAVVLEVGTVSGAMSGVLLHGLLNEKIIFIFFGIFLLWSSWLMLRKRKDVVEVVGSKPHPWADFLNLHGEYLNEHGEKKKYFVESLPLGILAMFGSGVLSALLGIGGGGLKVLAMDGFMKLPIRTSSATANFMIGVTAAASAGAFFVNGDVDIHLAVPVAAGVLVGSVIGARKMLKLRAAQIRRVFIGLFIFMGLQMLWKGMGK